MASVVHATSLDSRDTTAVTALAASQWDSEEAQDAWKLTHEKCWKTDADGVMWVLVPRVIDAMDCVGFANSKGSSSVSYMGM